MVVAGPKWAPLLTLVIERSSSRSPLGILGMMLRFWRCGITCTNIPRPIYQIRGNPACVNLMQSSEILLVASDLKLDIVVLTALQKTLCCSCIAMHTWNCSFFDACCMVLHVFACFCDKPLPRNEREIARNEREIARNERKKKCVPLDL